MTTSPKWWERSKSKSCSVMYLKTVGWWMCSRAKQQMPYNSKISPIGEIGEREYMNFVKLRILRVSSPVQEAQTADNGSSKDWQEDVVTEGQGEMKQATKCLEEGCNATGQQYDQSVEQYYIYPIALSDCTGKPNKGYGRWNSKSSSLEHSVRPYTPEAIYTGCSRHRLYMLLLNTNPRRQYPFTPTSQPASIWVIH